MKKDDITELAMKTIATLEERGCGANKADMDLDGDGSISLSELKAALSRMKTAKEKRKAMIVYIGDKTADFLVVGLALVVFFYTGNLLL